MILWTLGVIAAFILILVLLSPLESLRWWADKGEVEVRSSFAVLPSRERATTSSHHFMVYLSGVGVIGGDALSRRELAWLESVEQALPNVVVVDDVFPYAVDNRGLLQRATVWLWGRLDAMRRQWKSNPLGMLINVRNIAKVLVSADPRYGPTQSIGLAQEIWHALQRRGYEPGSGDRVSIVGFSGGAQMGLGAGWFLAGLGVRTELVTIGGIFGDDPGLDRMSHVWNITGSGDRLRHLGSVIFPGRWVTAPLSTWGRAKREGRVSFKSIGPMRHDGGRAYFGRSRFLSDGRSYADATRDAVVEILQTQQ